MGPTEIKIGGLGGQGVILGGIIIGKAAALFDDKHSCLTQAFGPEARGSACSAQVVVDTSPILYPYVHRPHLMVAMSQDAFVKFSPELRPDGTLLIEEDLVKPAGLPPTVKVYAVPATRIAEELGKKMVLNIVMVGFFTAVTGLVSEQAAREAVKDSVPPATVELNMKAFDRGYAYGKQLLAAKA
ncbi:2-oxoacid:acceptor oxidoreductase family protein [Anaeromyxobacter paludicola]|uniref:2-oxoglutarate ferredoxin oxidoreductase subunit gamma n=1 Tax=Anaeromyxobacter paludicola TaxID=2918171 RepID=A0ABN6N699_9BACT|nr:2-oxoacid:acceptor oxidoreductase family protein [Anaeromyxobacter paludicola]BDG07462.1 2-oxoglutarate ferredoxin oxidoreductase subunit gamma [Anaeromyxobacter paludicola]